VPGLRTTNILTFRAPGKPFAEDATNALPITKFCFLIALVDEIYIAATPKVNNPGIEPWIDEDVGRICITPNDVTLV